MAKDKVGSIRNVATRSGTWVMRLRHRPYGYLIDSVGSGVQLRYRWTGREWDAELGWYFMRARYYDPMVSRFTQEDPIGYRGGGNLYGYVGGSPLEARDPRGLAKSNVDGPFEGFCFGGGSCVNWDGSVTHGGSGWDTGGGGGGGGWGFGSLAGMLTEGEIRGTTCRVWGVDGKCETYSKETPRNALGNWDWGTTDPATDPKHPPFTPQTRVYLLDSSGEFFHGGTSGGKQFTSEDIYTIGIGTGVFGPRLEKVNRGKADFDLRRLWADRDRTINNVYYVGTMTLDDYTYDVRVDVSKQTELAVVIILSVRMRSKT